MTQTDAEAELTRLREAIDAVAVDRRRDHVRAETGALPDQLTRLQVVRPDLVRRGDDQVGRMAARRARPRLW